LLSSAPAIVEASGHSKRYEIWKQCDGLQSDCFTVGEGEADQANVHFGGSDPSIVGNKIKVMQVAEGNAVKQTGVAVVE
jgi:hypothetical protein